MSIDVGDAVRRWSAPSSCPTWSRTPAPPGTGTGCTTTAPGSPSAASTARSSTASSSARCSPRWCSTGPGPASTLTALSFRFKNLVFAGETVRCSGRSPRSPPTGSSSRWPWSVDRGVLRRRRSSAARRPGRATGRCPAGRTGTGAAPWPMTVAIVGAAECDLGSTGLSVLGLQTQAVTRALADAGLSLRDVDGIATTGVARFSATSLAEHLGLAAVLDGLDVRRRQRLRDVRGPRRPGDRGRPVPHRGDLVRLQPALGAVALARRGLRGAHARGAVRAAVRPALPGVVLRDGRRPVPAPATAHARDALAEVAVAAREWALLNPAAFRYDAGPLTVDDVLDAKPVSTPARRRRLLPGHRRRGSGRAHLAGAGARPAEAADRGARLRREHHELLDDRRRRPHRHRRRRVRRRGVRPGRADARRRRRRPALRLVHDHRAAHPGGARLLRPGRGAGVRPRAGRCR